MHAVIISYCIVVYFIIDLFLSCTLGEMFGSVFRGHVSVGLIIGVGECPAF